jgi:hypothetical protein
VPDPVTPDFEALSKWRTGKGIGFFLTIDIFADDKYEFIHP